MSRRFFISLALLALLTAALITAGCTDQKTPATGEIKKFGSAAEIRQYIENNSRIVTDTWGESFATGNAVFVGESGVSVPQRAEATATSKGLGSALPSSGATGYSETNVQVAGVDEPDFVKNDGRYIYAISGDTLTIADAYPATSASVISRTALEDTPREIFVSGNRLVLFTTGSAVASDSSRPMYASQMKSMPYYGGYSPVTHVIFYDISDRKNPRPVKDYTIDGDYIDARLIGGSLYLITREQISLYRDAEFTVPVIKESGNIVASPDVYYFDNPERQYAFTTVTSFDISSGNEKDAKTYLAGSGNILYVSPDAIYLSYQKYHPIYRTMRGGAEPAVARAGTAGTSVGISVPVVMENFNALSETDKQRLITEMKGAEEESLLKKEIDQTTTVIHRIAIDNGAIAYAAKGEVPGYLKNQFALDEYNSNLRVATTSDVWTTRGQYEYNSVFVLDPAMKTIGSLTHIAEQEKIYSTRFMGDRLYMVTFKRVDPFFVIDLSTPASPKILGKLKLPGYSDYLHPYDKNYIIGLGKETGTNDWGGVSTQGLKLALFDVSDVEHPRLAGKVEIGDAGSDSAALSDHKAFLFDKEKNLLVIPARVVRQNAVQATKLSGDQPHVWYGAYVFGINPENGFALRGTVEHGTGGTGYYYYGSSQNEVKRSLYIGDTLYTLSAAKILANPLDRINTTIATIPLNGKEDVLYPPVKMTA
ncbi:beta-propeller domain-containing protein [Methanoregula sp.]|uniref:beta-propeller domain-containing protein n=1 Tax=Methanoregula sp. TaxID=2052170 RepID=UPI003568280B